MQLLIAQWKREDRIFMTMKQVFIFLLTSLAFVGMGRKEKWTEEHHHVGQTVVELEGDKRWLDNAEATQGIQVIIGLTDAYLANPSPGWKPLKENIMSELTDVFQKCMKGESHNKLHNYLLPLKDKLVILSSSGDVQTVEDIKLYLETYKN